MTTLPEAIAEMRGRLASKEAALDPADATFVLAWMDNHLGVFINSAGGGGVTAIERATRFASPAEARAVGTCTNGRGDVAQPVYRYTALRSDIAAMKDVIAFLEQRAVELEAA